MDVKALIEKMKKEDRLLSEDAVMKAVQQSLMKMGYEPLGEEVLAIFQTLENIPVAYDVEKVVAELEQQAEQYRNRGFEHEQKGLSAMADKYYAKQCSYLHAIDIVKRGGAE